MADFTVIADTGAALLRLLREHMCPDPLISPESIQMIAPSDKNGDFQLGMYLYDIRELGEYRATSPIQYEGNMRTRPPSPLSLYYLLFLNSKAQIAAGAETEQRVFGKAMQTLLDYNVLKLSDVNPYISESENETMVSPITMSFEDKTKIWSALQCPYQVGVYFMVSPLLLSSGIKERFTRVTDGRVEIKIK